MWDGFSTRPRPGRRPSCGRRTVENPFHIRGTPRARACEVMSTNDVIRLIGDQEWIDAAASPLQNAVRAVVRGAVKDFLHGKALGHPLHPALTDVPIGAWSVAAIVDGLELARGRRRTRAADTAIKIGLAGAVASAVTGLTDWSETDARAKRIG